MGALSRLLVIHNFSQFCEEENRVAHQIVVGQDWINRAAVIFGEGGGDHPAYG
jgi:hypothetical protein